MRIVKVALSIAFACNMLVPPIAWSRSGHIWAGAGAPGGAKSAADDQQDPALTLEKENKQAAKSKNANAEPQEDEQPQSQVATRIGGDHGEQLDDLLDAVSGDHWKSLYLDGRKDFENRKYASAEHKLLEAVKESKGGVANTRKLIWARNALGDVYLAMNRVEDASKLYDWCIGAARREMGAISEAEAHAQNGLANVLLIKGRPEMAQQLCKESIKARRKLQGADSREYGQSLITMGAVLSKLGWPDQANRFFDAGLTVLEKAPGNRKLDYADALRVAALWKQRQGQRVESLNLFEKCYAIKDQSVHYDQTPQLQGLIDFVWEEGSPRSEEIPDPIVPLRYVCSNGVRVACTVVDLWELFGVLISVTNVGDHRVEIGLGKVSFLRTSGDQFDPKAERLELIAPDHIDRVRRDLDIWRLTSTRPWLANMQKTRNIRGLVPAKGHDLFRGPNVFGIYGEWAASNRVLPDKFQLNPSPERVEYQAQVVIDPSLIHTSEVNIPGVTPVSLEPFESRTGEQFYMNPRCEHVLLRIPVGNAIFEFPFKMPRKRTGY